MYLINYLTCAGGTTAGLVSCFHVLSAYSGYFSRKAVRPLPPTLNTLPTSGQWIKGDLTELNEALNRSEISAVTCFSCGDAKHVEVTIMYSESSLSFPAKYRCRQNDSLLS